MVLKKKLIEVALPLEAINKASAREKSIRHGHPSTLHLWWARRPLASARAVIFAQMVDDPSAHPELFPTEEAQDQERQRLFRLIEQLVQWENTTNEAVLEPAREEIRKSWRRTCADNRDHPRAAELFNPDRLPAFHDPFAGGGSLPLEAQRLGLEAYASDLNPVAVLINKAMIEIPPKFANRPPVNPEARQNQDLFEKEWRGARGLAEDVRYYGKWMRDQAEQRIGHLYPKVEITAAMAVERPDLKPLVGRRLTVIAWLWARTVKSPNPAFRHIDVPLASTFMLSTKPGKEAYVEPVIEPDGYRFTVKMGKPKDTEAAKNGTKLTRGANFRCLMSGSPITGNYIKAEGKAGRMGARMMAIVAEGNRGRIYMAPINEHEEIALQAKAEWKPEIKICGSTQYIGVTSYGMIRFDQLFTERQLVALTEISVIASKAIECIKNEAVNVGMKIGFPLSEYAGFKLNSSEMISSNAYAESVGVYLSFALSRISQYWSNITCWHNSGEKLQPVFGRQAIPMVWDYAEGNPFSSSTGNFVGSIDWITKFLMTLCQGTQGFSANSEATTQSLSINKIISTDPPYYDNVPYADLSDFFYVWLRSALKHVFPDMFVTLAVSKDKELVAFAYRHKSKTEANNFFLKGMTQAMISIANQTHPFFPVTIYYAFKQYETKNQIVHASSGWETFLEAVIHSGFNISGTLPMRTEMKGRVRDRGESNALASSIVLVCRSKQGEKNIATATRREFISALKTELPAALKHLQHGNIAPVDLAQAAIGPGMAIYTRYDKVLDAEGKTVSVREALALINQTLDEVLAEQEGDFDADSRWALAWFEQAGFAEGEYGVAETLSKAKNTSVTGMVEAGILASRRGKVRLLLPAELPANWDQARDSRLTVWEMVHHLIRVLEAGGESAAAELVKKLGSRAEIARELAYRLYTVCERKKRAQEALSYNALVQSWPEIVRLAQQTQAKPQQGDLFST